MVEVRDDGREVPALSVAVRDRVECRDLLALLAVPAVLVTVFALPAQTRADLAFSYEQPTLLAAYASHYVHLDRSHLLVNLGGYLLVVPTAYLLSVAANRRRQFLVVFVALVVAFPLVLSALNLLFVRPRVGVGFSGIVMGFVGYLPVAIIGVATRRLHVPVDRVRSQSLFFLGLALIAFVSVPGLVGTAIAAASGLAALLFLIPVVENWDRSRHDRIRRAVGRAGNLELLLLGVVVFVGYLFVAFPEDVAVSDDGTVINLYSHLLGYALGYVGTYLSLLSGALDVD